MLSSSCALGNSGVDCRESGKSMEDAAGSAEASDEAGSAVRVGGFFGILFVVFFFCWKKRRCCILWRSVTLDCKVVRTLSSEGS